MSKIEIKIESDGFTAQQSQFLASFLQALGTPAVTTDLKSIPVISEEIISEKPKQIHKIKKVEKAEEQAEEQAEVTIEQIRAMVALKQAKHKIKLRSKLDEFGAKNVSTLEPKYFSKFHTYMLSLS